MGYPFSPIPPHGARATRSRESWGAGLSILAHGALLFVIGLHAEKLPPSSHELSPLRFVGQTFNIDSLSTEPISTHLAIPPPVLSDVQEPSDETEVKLAHSPSMEPTSSPPSSLSSSPVSRKPTVLKPPKAPLGTYGEEGPPAGTVDLFAAFLKTLPLAAKSDPKWHRLPLGPAGSVQLLLTLNEESRLLPVEIVDTPNQVTPQHLKRLVKVNRNFLLRGRFAISTQVGEGTQKLKLSATISSKAPDLETPQADGVRAFGLRGGTSATSAYFTYFSGRHVELSLERL